MMKYLTLDRDNLILQTTGCKRLVGIDEVGRGCFAGPVAVGAYIFQPDTQFIKGVNDSKLVSPKKRVLLSKNLESHPHQVMLGDVEEINQKGIGKTLHRLIQAVVDQFNDGDTYFLIDGRFARDFGKNTLKVIKADSTYYCVAAASILAKVYRDNLMRKLDLQFPGYGFARNKGYGTREHRRVLSVMGLSDLHRRSFNIKF